MPQGSATSQIIETEISGPAGANRLYLCTRVADINMQADQGSRTETWTFLVGPTLQGTQFRRATATASIVRWVAHLGRLPGPIHLWAESGIRGS
jgi:hypothetical protein